MVVCFLHRYFFCGKEKGLWSHRALTQACLGIECKTKFFWFFSYTPKGGKSMAGVEPKKTNVKNLRNMKAHYDEKMRATHNHRNTHIDKTKTHLNYNLAIQDGEITKDITWKEIVNRCSSKVKELDKLHPPRKNVQGRKTVYDFVIWSPNEIKDQEKFFKRFMEEYNKAFPDSLMGAQVHNDEQHWYIDPLTKIERLSMKHLHGFGVANDKEKGCNMKAFMNREWFNKVNQICKEVAKEQGVEYHTGEGHHTSRSMEQMKWESNKALQDKIKNQKDELQTVQIAIKEEQTTLTQVKEELGEINLNKENLLRDLWNEIKNLFKSLKTQEKRQDVLEGRVGKQNRIFGRANALKEQANKELDKLTQQETINSIYLDEIPGIKRTRTATNSYKEELDRIENVLQEDLVPDDDFDR